ncbi:MAG: NAD(P)/FAD-dependent oxidoreductase [Chloroflexi bacterium]|nr:MAG: NAD(P)/FAD-dependent oxidoreductase [Chloroflexota bacterium]RLC86023.1 MAG: NAD(P)/FAD-dependent oxidoreductase [Chloroflexota bacterium]
MALPREIPESPTVQRGWFLNTTEICARTDDTTFDVIIVGAGPIGSTIAEVLARASLRVALLEEHPNVGLPDHCSGLVSPRTLDLAGIAGERVGLLRFSRARVWSPGGKTLWLDSNSVQAVAIDRPRFDRLIAERAVEAGACLMLETQACCFERSARGVQVEVRAGAHVFHLCAPLLIGADGANSRVARWMDGRRRNETIPAVKADIAFRGAGTDSIEIFVGNDVAPGWFGWIIPMPDGMARIGIGATRSPRRYFEAFLESIRSRFGDFVVHETRQAPLPLGPARDFVADRVMLVGAAARQTKPTTGGGLYFGIRAAQLAAATAVEAIKQGDCSKKVLVEYERAWHRSEGRELAVNHWLRKGFCALSDRGFDLIVELFGKPRAQKWISHLGDMDYPSRLLGSLPTLGRKRVMLPETMEARQRAGLRA